MTAQQHLFGEPELRPALSQWHTPAWIARRLAAWVPAGARVLEPSCGAGNLIAQLLNKHDGSTVVGIELDELWAKHARQRFALNAVEIRHGDFLAESWGRFGCVLMNPPFENGLHAAFLEHALEHAPVIVGLFPVAIEFGEERDRLFWARKARVTRRARLPERVKYGGDSQASFETVALRIEPRTSIREPDEVLAVAEEVWRKPAE